MARRNEVGAGYGAGLRTIYLATGVVALAMGALSFVVVRGPRPAAA